MTLYISKFLGAAALLTISTQTTAQTSDANHTLGSALDVWRVELRNPERLLAMSAGDSDGVSELHKVEIKLAGTDGQMHAITESNPYFRVNEGSRKVAEWIGVRQGDRVKLDRVDERNTNTYNLWVHTKQRALSAPAITFELSITAQELDCRGDHVCGRSDTGIVTYGFSIPVPTNRSLSCAPDNRYRITAVNGATIRLSPLLRGSSSVEATAAPQYSGASSGIDIASGTVVGPHLALQGGEICIAATKLLPRLPDVRPEPPAIPRDRKLPGQR